MGSLVGSKTLNCSVTGASEHSAGCVDHPQHPLGVADVVGLTKKHRKGSLKGNLYRYFHQGKRLYKDDS